MIQLDRDQQYRLQSVLDLLQPEPKVPDAAPEKPKFYRKNAIVKWKAAEEDRICREKEEVVDFCEEDLERSSASVAATLSLMDGLMDHKY